MRKSPAKNEEVGDFLAHIKKKLYFCSGIKKGPGYHLWKRTKVGGGWHPPGTQRRKKNSALSRRAGDELKETNKPKTLKL